MTLQSKIPQSAIRNPHSNDAVLLDELAQLAARRIGLRIPDDAREHCGCFYLDRQNRLVAFHEVSAGMLNGTLVSPREVLGPALRRGVTDLDGHGEVVAGIVVMRQGENALDVVRAVKAKLDEIEKQQAAKGKMSL